MDTLNLKNSLIYVDTLLIGQITEPERSERETKPPRGIFNLNADSYTLKGRAKIIDDPTILLNLKNNTT
ncbi:hypothetical protein O9A_00677 [Bartonella koehlerae C-29]|uniref:Uncharacterized protein n=1 Tax=Bartonella koehlerae C-29 TaxID=1134510 RepID=A0A067WHK1_9HYPH|nr:hypothetical protein O9A_00677 [Bartonella koehlerae C-29]